MATKKRLSFEELLDRHAQVAVHVGLRPAVDQPVIMSVNSECLPFARLVAKHLYQAGAASVTTLIDDDELTLARYRHARDESFDYAPAWLSQAMVSAFTDGGAARLGIFGGNPGLLAGQDSSRVGRAAVASAKVGKPVSDCVTSGLINWSISAAATQAWAQQAFPELTPRRALGKLWRAIFAASRADTEDPIAAWAKHNETLAARKALLNEHRFSALRFRGPGTDLVVGLADDHLWAGGESRSKGGIVFNANIPTEEVFTTPHCRRVDGYVTATRPLSLHGNILEGIFVRFKDGLIVEATAKTGEATLKHHIATDEGASRLGEIALVPHSSPISAGGLLFYNTLFDENAACHMAVGNSYSKCIKNGGNLSKDQLLAQGANQSNIHTDWMIGSGAVDVDGIRANGDVVPVMRACEWA